MSKGLEHFDVVVIGSGFGGAVAACRLSQAGFNVLLLERGRRYEANDFPALPDDDRLMPDLRRWVWKQDQGLWDIQDLGEIIAVQAAGYGGGSLIYANVHLRPPSGNFDRTDAVTGLKTWPSKFQGEKLEPYFDLAAHMLNVAPITEHKGQPFAKTETLDAVTQSLNRKSLRPPLAINYEAKAESDTSDAQKACTACGKCCSGCSEGAKNSLDLNYLAVAERHGAHVRTQCEVTGLRELQAVGASAWEVTYINHLTASLERLTVPNVFVCAGAVNSTRLLKRAELLPPSQGVLERVGLGYFPNADALGMIYETNRVCSPSSGPAITTSTVHWAKDRFFMIQDGGYAPQLERLLGAFRASIWAGRNRAQVAAPVDQAVADAPRPRTPFPGVALVSPLDAVLDAAAGGALGDAAPKQFSQALPGFYGLLQQALLLTPVVDGTIERALSARYASSRLSRWLSYESTPIKLGRRAVKGFVQFITGGTEPLSDHAFRSVINGGDLDRNSYAQKLLGYDDAGANRRMMLLAMGQDAAPGALVIDDQSRELVADLDLFHLIDGYTEQELLMKDIAQRLGGELRLNPLWSFYGKPITVHSQGGCRMSEDPARGVTRPDGQVHGCPGLYVLDGSILCQSVGVNPTPSILAIAESNVLDFIRRKKANAAWPANDSSRGAQEYAAHVAGAKRWRARARLNHWQLRPAPEPFVAIESAPLGLKFRELFNGYCAPSTGEPLQHAADYRRLETKGRPAHPFKLDLEVSCPNLSKFFEDQQHRLQLSGTLTYSLPGTPTKTERVTGFLELLVERRKDYGLEGQLAQLQAEIAGSYTTVKEPRARQGKLEEPERVMYYHLSSTDSDLRLEGHKLVSEDPGLDAWRDTTALFTKLGRTRPGSADDPRAKLETTLEASAAGVLHVDLTSFIYRELPSFLVTGGEKTSGEKRESMLPDIEVTGTTDPARIQWAIAKFVGYFFGTLLRVYSPSVRSVLDAVMKPLPNGVRHEPRELRV